MQPILLAGRGHEDSAPTRGREWSTVTRGAFTTESIGKVTLDGTYLRAPPSARDLYLDLVVMVEYRISILI